MLITGVSCMKYTFSTCIILFSFIVALQGCKTKEEAAASKALNSAEQGAAIGQFKLGKMYAKGEGVELNNVYAHMWANAAVVQGLGDSANELKISLEKKMTASEIEAAEKLYNECKNKSYKSC